MKMPLRAEFGKNSASYLAAITGWMGASEVAYQRLRERYDATEASSIKPEWFEVPRRGKTLRWVECDDHPKEFDERVVVPQLHVLSSNIMECDGEITNLCHGIFDGKWICCVELKVR